MKNLSQVISGLLQGVLQLLKLSLAVSDSRAPTLLSILNSFFVFSILQRAQRECICSPPTEQGFSSSPASVTELKQYNT